MRAEQSTLDAVQSVKDSAVKAIAESGKPPTRETSDQTDTQNKENPAVTKETVNVGKSSLVSLFSVGDLVSLRSDPTVLLPIIEVVPGGAECRYRVFQDNAKVTYYERQLQAVQAVSDGFESLSVAELHAHLTSIQLLSPFQEGNFDAEASG